MRMLVVCICVYTHVEEFSTGALCDLRGSMSLLPSGAPFSKKKKNYTFYFTTVLVVGIKMSVRGFPDCAVVKNPPANAGDMGLIPGPGRSHMSRSN